MKKISENLPGQEEVNAWGLTLPVEIVKDLKWRERQKVVVKKVRGGVLIKDWKK